MSILLIAQQKAGKLNAQIYPLIQAAQKIGGEIQAVVTGVGAKEAAQTLAQAPAIQTVYASEAEHLSHGLAEHLVPLVKTLSQEGVTHILAASTTYGKNFIPRLAGSLAVMPITEVVAIEGKDTYVRPIYAGNALETVQSSDALQLLTVRTTAFDAAEKAGGSATIENCSAEAGLDRVAFVSADTPELTRPELTQAAVIVSGGRALGSQENFALIDKLADKLGAAVGASRAAVDAGYVPNDYQVGQTGKIVAPELYIAIGISGAIQHLAGMKDSKTIIAINQDENAPIFEIADYRLVGDLFEIVPELLEAL